MDVVKIGGAIIKSIDDLYHIIKLINEQKPTLVIFSALSKTSAELRNLLLIAENNKNFANSLNVIKNFHLSFVSLEQSKKKIFEYIFEINNILEAIRLIGESTPQASDKLLSYGEKLASVVYFEIFNVNYKSVRLLDASKLIKTDSNFGDANPNIKDSVCNLKTEVDYNSLNLLAGFIGSDNYGNPTTMGFETSSLTSVISSMAINSKSILWVSDVNGIYSADPNNFPNAQLINNINYEFANQLALNKFKLFPKNVIALAQENEIIIKLGNTLISKDDNEERHLLIEKDDHYLIVGDPKKIILYLINMDKIVKIVIEKNKVCIFGKIDPNQLLNIISIN